MDSQNSSFFSKPTSKSEAKLHSNNNLSCSICKKAEGKIAEISDVDELKGIKERILQYSNIIKNVTHACLNCLYKLYTFIEHNRIKDYKKSRNQHLFVIGDLIVENGGIRPSVFLSSDSSTSSSSNSSIIPDEGIFEREFVGGKSIQLYNEYPVKSREVNEVVLDSKDSMEESINQHSSSNHLDELDVLYEHSESALVSESGGNPDQYKIGPQRCLYCSKTFVRGKMYNRHLRSHENKLRSRTKSAPKSRPTTATIVYKCNHCPTTFPSSQMLKKHSKIHLQQYGCSHCHLYFFTICERDIHQAECFGKKMAKISIKRHSTRSVTRSVAAQSTYSQFSNDHGPKRLLRLGIRSSKNSDSSTVDNDDDDDNNDIDEVSVSCSDHFSAVESWVNKSCQMLCSELAEVPPLILSQKEYDIVMLERLIDQSEKYQYTCTFIGCEFITNSLRDMSFHEVKTHKSKTYYSCRKCKGRFTSKLFLDYHLYMQNYGEYHCHKCTMTFIYEYKLQQHLLQHQQHPSFPCLYCDSSFMSEIELMMHSIDSGHNTKKRKKTICIDRSMTITNKIGPEASLQKKVYREEDKILVLPKTETKRPMQIIWPKYTKIFLGNLDFEYEPGRNCIRTN